MTMVIVSTVIGMFVLAVLFGAFCFQLGLTKGYADVLTGSGEVPTTIRSYLIAVGANQPTLETQDIEQ